MCYANNRKRSARGENGPHASASDQKSPLGVPMNENSQRARDKDPHIKYKRSARTKKVRTRRAEFCTFNRILSACATQAIENGSLAEIMVRTRSASDQKSPLEVLVNENGPRARDIGPPVTYKCFTRTKKVRRRRLEVHTFDRILSTYATLAIEKVPLAKSVPRAKRE